MGDDDDLKARASIAGVRGRNVIRVSQNYQDEMTKKLPSQYQKGRIGRMSHPGNVAFHVPHQIFNPE